MSKRPQSSTDKLFRAQLPHLVRDFSCSSSTTRGATVTLTRLDTEHIAIMTDATMIVTPTTPNRTVTSSSDVFVPSRKIHMLNNTNNAHAIRVNTCCQKYQAKYSWLAASTPDRINSIKVQFLCAVRPESQHLAHCLVQIFNRAVIHDG